LPDVQTPLLPDLGQTNADIENGDAVKQLTISHLRHLGDIDEGGLLMKRYANTSMPENFATRDSRLPKRIRPFPVTTNARLAILQIRCGSSDYA